LHTWFRAFARISIEEGATVMIENRLFKLALLLLLLALCVLSLPAQIRIAGSISGTITDPTGAVVPSAKVELRDEGTGITKSTTANGQGEFLFPDLNFGLYGISVTVQGFRTEKIDHVKVEASRVTDVRVKLTVGQTSETVNVEGVAPLLETTQNLISSTISAEAVKDLPLNGRGTLGLARLVPGQQTPLGNGDTHFNGLPGGAVNVTTDGINNASNGFKSGGTVFFQTVPARLGGVQEIAVETAGLGAESGAESGANLKFITKRGTNQFHGNLYWQPTSSQFNANSWLNKARGIPTPNLRIHDFGGSIGGPLIPISKWGLKNKLFFFVNWEETYQPQQTSHSFPYLTALAQQGIFTYRATNGTMQTANVLQIAQNHGFQGTIDPTIASYVLAHQNQALSNGFLTPINNNFNQQTFTFLTPEPLWSYFPTARLDYQATSKLAIQGTWNLRHFRDPGFPQTPISGQPDQSQFKIAGYWLYSLGANYSFSPRTFNEFRYGVQHSGDTIPNTGPQLYDIGGGRRLRLGLPLSTPSLVLDQSPVTGRHYITTIYDTATLIRGTHTFTVGGNYRRTDWKDIAVAGPNGVLGAPFFSIGNQASDPIGSITVFGPGTLPGISTTNGDIGTAIALYDLLTARMNSVNDGAVVNPNTLQYGGPENFTWTRSYMGGFYGQDSWRFRPNLTLNFGLREEMQGAPFNVNGITAFPDLANFFGPSVGLFQPGTLSGNNNPVNLVGQHVANARLDNVAPNLGFAWNPRGEKGFFGKVLNRSTVIRGGFSMVYYDEGTQMFAAGAGNNPGKLQSLQIVPGQNGVPFGLTLQSPLPAFTSFPGAYATTFHQADFTFGNTFQTMAPNLRTPYTENWNFGVEREIMKDTVLEARYVGDESHSGWRRINYNEVNIFENGFLQEFQNAQNNLKINAANGFANTFQNKGLPGEVALPIFDAAFAARGTCTGCGAILGNYSNGGFITDLQTGQAGLLANSLATSSAFVCRMFGSTFSPCANKFGFNAPGPYPINFFLTNPFSAGNLLLTEDSGATKYNSLQINLRGRRGQSFTYVANYTWSHSFSNIWGDNANNDGPIKTIRNKAGDMAPSPFDQRHVFNFYSLYDLPVGKNKMINIRNPIVDTFLGGWKVSGILTIASGNVFRLGSGRDLVNLNDAGIVLPSGVNADTVQQAFNITPVGGSSTNKFFLPSSMIGADGRANPNFFITPTTPGLFGSYLYLYGRNNWNIDSSISKTFSLTERWKLNLWMSALNVLNHPIFNPSGAGTTLSIQSATFGQITNGPANGARVLQFRANVAF
jgi:hypothetical protein